MKKRIKTIEYDLDNDKNLPDCFFSKLANSLKKKYKVLYKEFEEFIIYKDEFLKQPISSNKLIRTNQLEQRNKINELRNTSYRDLNNLGCFIDKIELYKDYDLMDRNYPNEEIKKGILKAVNKIMKNKNLFDKFVDVVYSSIINQDYKHFYSEFYNILEKNIKGMEIDKFSSLYSKISIHLTYEIFGIELPEQKKPNSRVSKGSKYGTYTLQYKRTNPTKN